MKLRLIVLRSFLLFRSLCLPNHERNCFFELIQRLDKALGFEKG